MVRIEYNYKKDIDFLEIKTPIPLKELLRKLNINPEEVIVKEDNKIITEEDKIENKSHIKIFRVVSGG